jgi:hypothetical protein
VTELRRVNRGKNHSYYDGSRKLDGVTTLLSDGVPKPALIAWAGNTTAEYAVDHWSELADLSHTARLAKLKGARYEDLDKAAKRGTEVHGLAERLVHRESEGVEVPDELAGHVESYVRFLDTWQIEPVLVEVELFNLTWGYAGTADLLAQLPNGHRVWMDIKTTRSGIFGETALQLCAYAHCEIALVDGEEIDVASYRADPEVACAIHVRADGYDVHPLPIGAETWTTFRHVIKVARAARDLRDLVGPSITPGELAV